MIPSHRNQSVNTHQFAMVPKAEIPRSSFLVEHTHKTTFDENYLIPIYCDEVLPGDTHSLRMQGFARLATPIFPLMDNMYMDTFFFFVPVRLVWAKWQQFMGEQANPGDSISYSIPQQVSPVGGFVTGTLADYFGLPCGGQIGGASTISINTLPFRCYNQIWNQWFRDENLQSSVDRNTGDGPDLSTLFGLLKRGKRHDYFTAALPWTQKGGTAITIPLGTSAPVKGIGYSGAIAPVGGFTARESGGNTRGYTWSSKTTVAADLAMEMTTGVAGTAFPTIYADLTAATGATINALRQSFQIQKLLERDARGGTRYTEIVRSHFGVISPDARLQRPEYLGGGTTPVNINPIPQTSATGLTGGTTPVGTLSAYATMLAQGHGFTQSFTEHGYILGLVNIRADITYQQGIRQMWRRNTRYDFYVPAFAMLGEQPVYNYEIYAIGSATGGITPGDQDLNVFGYQERWADYRYMPSIISGQFKSYYATPLDAWHLAEKFTALPTLGATFIQTNTPITRTVAVASAGAHFMFDAMFSVKKTRPMPLYSVPGLIDHF